jgi:hypothetical protein
MSGLGIRFVALCALVLAPALAMAGSDMYLKIEGVEGESRVVHCADGACLVDSLAPGKYSVLISDAEGKVVPSDIKLTYSVTSPRDSATGQASGKRMHKPLTISKEWGRGATPTNEITIEEAGTQLVIGDSDAAVEAAQAKITKSRSNIQNN